MLAVYSPLGDTGESASKEVKCADGKRAGCRSIELVLYRDR